MPPFTHSKYNSHDDLQKMYAEDFFINGWNIYSGVAYSVNVDNGFWEEKRNQGALIALMHSELSEALEALRHDNPPDDKIPEFDGLTAELADCVIRIMDFAVGYELDVAGAIVAKVKYNMTREKKHGKKF